LLGWLSKSPFTPFNKRVALFTLISAHTQLLIGFVLYFISPLVQFNAGTMKNDTTRYFTVEHWVMMIIAIALITIGYSKSKKLVLPEAKHRVIFIFYGIAILVVMGALAAGHIPILK
jgi:membrane protein DedA with SNARE-associated domain